MMDLLIENQSFREKISAQPTTTAGLFCPAAIGTGLENPY
jgi:hypothetical protein